MSAAESVHQRLLADADPEHAKALRWFFKTAPGEYGEGDQFLGLRAAPVRKAVREFRALSLDDIDEVIRSPWHEERSVAVLLLAEQYGRADAKRQQEIYRFYLAHTQWINNWDLVDISAPHVVGAHLMKRSRAPLRKLARSQSLWERRIAIISTLWFIRERDFDETLRVAEVLLHDRHDLIHKAVGWMLREVGNRDRAVLEDFLRKHAAEMPRTMLRYAIEKFPEAKRKWWLARRPGMPARGGQDARTAITSSRRTR